MDLLGSRVAWGAVCVSAAAAGNGAFRTWAGDYYYGQGCGLEFQGAKIFTTEGTEERTELHRVEQKLPICEDCYSFLRLGFNLWGIPMHSSARWQRVSGGGGVGIGVGNTPSKIGRNSLIFWR